MNREVCKFLSGSFAALGYAHGAYAVATSRGILNQPVFLGRRWGVGFVWSEAAVYSALAVVLGYIGWVGGAHKQERSARTLAVQSAAESEAPPASVD
jgi:hypothetical protein